MAKSYHGRVRQELYPSIVYILVLSLLATLHFKLFNCGILCSHIKGLHLNQQNRSRTSYASSELGSTGSKLHANGKHHNHKHHSSIDRRDRATRAGRAVYLATLDDTKVEPWIRNYSNSNPHIQHHYGKNSGQCCACDEAKYELVFEGLWSRYTHPDDFPEDYWLAHFSDIIGASHSSDFKMWSQDAYATEGVRDLAETGSTKRLEFELKQVSSKTRTIIKARELRHPTLNSKTSAIFRTDRHHHLVSILSKLGPSPDWMVGVSGLELCQLDCSWSAQRVVNLYLWDAGTDSGSTFTAADLPTNPAEKVHPYRKWPNKGDSHTSESSTGRRPIHGDQSSQVSQDDLFSRGFDTSGFGTSSESHPGFADQSKPYARLTVTRQRIYEKPCTNDSPLSNTRHVASFQSNLNDRNDIPSTSTRSSLSDCRFTEWSDWSACSSTFGKGIRTRTRSFINDQALASGCSSIDLLEKEVCLSECFGNVTCVTRDWSEWSECSVTCGKGNRKRVRSPIGHLKRACKAIELVQMEPCMGPHGSECKNDPTSCEVTAWSPWSECSVPCGKGTKFRTRQYKNKETSENCHAKLIQKHSCMGKQESCRSNSKGKCNYLDPFYYFWVESNPICDFSSNIPAELLSRVDVLPYAFSEYGCNL